MKPHSATVWDHREGVCEFEDCDDAAAIRGLCDHHDRQLTDYIAEQIMEQHRDDPL